MFCPRKVPVGSMKSKSYVFICIYHNLSRYHVIIWPFGSGGSSNLLLRCTSEMERPRWSLMAERWAQLSLLSFSKKSWSSIEGDFGVLQKGRYHWRCDILPASYCFYVSKSFKFNPLTGGRLPPTGLSCPMCPIIKSKWKQVSCWLSLYPGNCTYWQLRL